MGIAKFEFNGCTAHFFIVRKRFNEIRRPISLVGLLAFLPPLQILAPFRCFTFSLGRSHTFNWTNKNLQLDAFLACLTNLERLVGPGKKNEEITQTKWRNHGKGDTIHLQNGGARGISKFGMYSRLPVAAGWISQLFFTGEQSWRVIRCSSGFVFGARIPF
jgi:hypothetical protein